MGRWLRSAVRLAAAADRTPWLAAAVARLHRALRRVVARARARHLRRLLRGAARGRQVRAPGVRPASGVEPVDEVGQPAGSLHAARRRAAAAGRRRAGACARAQRRCAARRARGVSGAAGARVDRRALIQERRPAQARRRAAAGAHRDRRCVARRPHAARAVAVAEPSAARCVARRCVRRRARRGAVPAAGGVGVRATPLRTAGATRCAGGLDRQRTMVGG